MKAYTHNILSIVFGLYFLVAGTGFNVVNYCCNICENEGVESVILESMHKTPHSKMSCCEMEKTQEMLCHSLEHPNSCNLTRLSVEPTTISSVLELKKDFSFQVVLFTDIQGRFLESFTVNSGSKYHLPPPEKALILKGRDILTAKAVLLI